MGPELHYQLIQERVHELQENAAAERRARQARRTPRSGKPGTGAQRSLFARLRTS